MKPIQTLLSKQILMAYLHSKAASEYLKFIKENLTEIENQELIDPIKQLHPKLNYLIARIEKDFKSEGITPETLEKVEELIFEVMDNMDKKMEELKI